MYGTGVSRCTAQAKAWAPEEFEKFVVVDMACKRNTTRNYSCCLRSFLSSHKFAIEEIRDFLLTVENPNTYNNYVKAFKAYARFQGWDLNIKQRPRWEPIRVLPSKNELREFYAALDTDYKRLAFRRLRRDGAQEARVAGPQDGPEKPAGAGHNPAKRSAHQEDLRHFLQRGV